MNPDKLNSISRICGINKEHSIFGNRKRNPGLLFLWWSAMLLLYMGLNNSCKTDRDKIDPGFSEHISAFTSGEISVASAIRIELSTEVSQVVQPNSEVKDELYDFSPNIQGKAFWVDAKTIEFRPDHWLKPGTNYEATFYLKKIKEVPRKFREFNFHFNTVKQNYRVDIDGYEPYTMDDRIYNRITGTVYTADVIDEKQLSKFLLASQDFKARKVNWLQSDDNRYTFQIDSIIRVKGESNVSVKWNGGAINVDHNGSENIVIPSIDDFKVLNVKASQEPNQHLDIRFSDPISRNQDLNGLITLADRSDLNFDIDKNLVRIYFSNPVNGTFPLFIQEAVLNSDGKKLANSFQTSVIFDQLKPAVRLTGKGNILPNSQGLIFPFEAVNLKAVDVRIIKIFDNNIPQFFQINDYDGESQLKRAGRLVVLKTLKLGGADKLKDYGKWAAYSIDLSELAKKEPGAIYRIELSFKKSYATYPCQEDTVKDDPLLQGLTEEDFEKELSYWDAGDDYYDYYAYDDGYYEDYNWEERDDPCSNSYYSQDKKVSCNLISSNLGITAKSNGNNQVSVAVANIVNTKPMKGVKINILNFQLQVIGSGTCDGDGFARIDVKGKPFLLVAQDHDQKGYLKLTDGNALSYSQFDVSGEIVSRGIKAYLYGERGVWRPGDSIFLTCMVENKINQLPENYPVILEIYNPQGQLFKKIIKTNGLNGFYVFNFKTQEDAPTGNWLAKVKLGTVEFSRTLKIETVKPNRLKVNLDLGKRMLATGHFTAMLNAKWLHGAPASNMNTDVTANLSATTTSFAGYDGYVFDDPTRSFEVQEKNLFSGKLDLDGNAKISSDISLEDHAPGFLKANVLTKVFEPGGDFSTDNQVVTLSPYVTYLGLKTPEGETGYLETDAAQEFQVATVDQNGKPVNAKGLEVYIYKLDRNWWWNASDEMLANYESVNFATPVYKSLINTQNGRAKFSFNLKYPDWGRFLVRIIDPKGGHATGKVIYFDWPGWRGRADRADAKNASMLMFSSDKKSYKVGEKATITFPSPKEGRILISIETGSNILKQWWNECSGKETKVSFEVTSDMAPNVYVYASLIQPHAAKLNDLPIRLYGVIPVQVENPESHLNPVLSLPGEIRPEQSFEVAVNEKNNQSMTYTLAIVDEGLIDITHYKTPDPWTAFYGREALGIKTWDLYDYILGAYGGKIEKLFAIGGDENLKSGDQSKANRFKPVVRFMGPFVLKGGTARHKIKLPPYIGSVKVMVVCGNGKGGFGSCDKTVAVKKPLMVIATLPRVVSPGETLDLPVSVFAMDSKMKDVVVDVSANSFFSFQSQKTKHLFFKQTGEQDLAFKVKINSKLGVGKVKVMVRCGNESDLTEIEINVRSSNPQVKTYFETITEGGKSVVLPYHLPGIAGTNQVTLEVSSIPAMNLTNRLGYLINYPYGCAEQTTSAAFPQLYLDKFMELDDISKKRTKENILAAINRLNSMQLGDGGVGYWPGASSADSWVTSYAGQFMLLAKEKGYELPYGFVKKWVKFQKKAARNWMMPANTEEYYMQSDLIQAYRLYTLALAGEEEVGAMNRLKESKGLSVQTIWRLAATYALIGQHEIAKQLMVKGGNEIKPYSGFNYTYGSEERDWAMILETYLLEKDKASAFVFMKKIADRMNADLWLSTQSTAFCLYAMGKAIETLNPGGPIHFTYAQNKGPKKTIQTASPVKQITLNGDALQGQILLNNLGKGTLFVRIVASGLPESGLSIPESANNLQMAVHYYDINENSIDIGNLRQGTDFFMEVAVKNPGQLGFYKDLALNQIVPSGCEIINTRLMEMASSDKTSAYDYMDIRDDRVLTYFNLSPGETKTFRIRLNASYGGKFYFPGVYCEAMYEAKVNALSAGKWIEIK